MGLGAKLMRVRHAPSNTKIFPKPRLFFCPEQLSKLVMAKADCHCNLSARRFFIFEILMILPLSKIETPFGKVRCVVRLLLQLCWYLMAMEAF